MVSRSRLVLHPVHDGVACLDVRIEQLLVAIVAGCAFASADNDLRLGAVGDGSDRLRLDALADRVGLAHEVRNPLGAIRGAVQLLRREIGPDSRLAEYTDVLLTEVDRVNRIIESLLDLARPIQLRAVPLNLHQLLERVTLLNEESARERGVSD